MRDTHTHTLTRCNSNTVVFMEHPHAIMRTTVSTPRGVPIDDYIVFDVVAVLNRSVVSVMFLGCDCVCVCYRFIVRFFVFVNDVINIKRSIS